MLYPLSYGRTVASDRSGSVAGPGPFPDQTPSTPMKKPRHKGGASVVAEVARFELAMGDKPKPH